MRRKKGVKRINKWTAKEYALFIAVGVLLVFLILNAVLPLDWSNLKSRSITGFSVSTPDTSKLIFEPGTDLQGEVEIKLQSNDLLDPDTVVKVFTSSPRYPSKYYCSDSTTIDYCYLDFSNGDYICEDLSDLLDSCGDTEVNLDAGTCSNVGGSCCNMLKGSGDFYPQHSCEATGKECREFCDSTTFYEKELTLQEFVALSSSPDKGKIINGDFNDNNYINPSTGQPDNPFTGSGYGFAPCESDQPEPCETDDDCSSGWTCLEGTCVECTKDSDCSAGKICYENSCVEEEELICNPACNDPEDSHWYAEECVKGECCRAENAICESDNDCCYVMECKDSGVFFGEGHIIKICQYPQQASETFCESDTTRCVDEDGDNPCEKGTMTIYNYQNNEWVKISEKTDECNNIQGSMEEYYCASSNENCEGLKKDYICPDGCESAVCFGTSENCQPPEGQQCTEQADCDSFDKYCGLCEGSEPWRCKDKKAEGEYCCTDYSHGTCGNTPKPYYKMCESGVCNADTCKCEGGGRDDCIGEGEASSNPSLGPDGYFGECCSGLVEIEHKEYYDENCVFSGELGLPIICSDCGNGFCESWESKCTCPADCSGGDPYSGGGGFSLSNFLNSLITGNFFAKITGNSITGYALTEDDSSSYTCEGWDSINKYSVSIEDLDLQTSTESGWNWINVILETPEGNEFYHSHDGFFVASEGDYHRECSNDVCGYFIGAGSDQCTKNSECEGCFSNWDCPSWETVECIGGLQTRTCVDLNNCGFEPSITLVQKSCTAVCVESWDCEYSECDKDSLTQVRLSETDFNNCGTYLDLENQCPSTRSCTLPGGSGGSGIPKWVPWVVLGVLIVAIVTIISLLLISKKAKRKQEIPAELVDYIKKANSRGMSKADIKKSLLNSGWNEKIIDSAFVVAFRPQTLQQPTGGRASNYRGTQFKRKY